MADDGRPAHDDGRDHGTLGGVRRWAVASASLAPAALIGGWSLGESRQPAGYDPVRDTISALAAHGATDRPIMTTGLAVLGVCHVMTAAGLTEASTCGRALLALGGAATVLVSALAQPATGHVTAAGIGFVALALWPAAALVPGRNSGRLATAALLALLAWLVAELRRGDLLGLSERTLTSAEAVWPLAVALTLVTSQRRTAARDR